MIDNFFALPTELNGKIHWGSKPFLKSERNHLIRSFYPFLDICIKNIVKTWKLESNRKEWKKSKTNTVTIRQKQINFNSIINLLCANKIDIEFTYHGRLY